MVTQSAHSLLNLQIPTTILAFYINESYIPFDYSKKLEKESSQQKHVYIFKRIIK